MRTRSGGWLALWALVLGCASSNQLANGQAGAPGVRKFLVCAPNTVITLPAELQGGSERLRAEIDAYLRHHARDVEWLDLYESQQAFGQALARAKEQGDTDRTGALFAEELAKTHTFDALVMPSIVLHEIRVLDNSGRWDGVSRWIRIANRPPIPAGGWGTMEKGVRAGGYTGEAAVTSVHLLVLSRVGARVFEGRGGVEFVNEIDLAAKDWRFAVRVRDDLFEDGGALREGIVLAFDPYLPPPEEF
jgi:hypothetical protein